jgi:hypothetical protein
MDAFSQERIAKNTVIGCLAQLVADTAVSIIIALLGADLHQQSLSF